MYILYLDESGNPSGWNKGQRNLVLGGVAVFEGEIRKITSSVDALQNKYFPGIPIPLEFHSSEIFSGKNAFRALPYDDRKSILKDLASVLTSNSITTFATGIHISQVHSPDQALQDVFGDVCTRFNTMLLRHHHADKPQKGLLIIDKSQYSEKLFQDMISFRKSGTKHAAYLGNIVDIPYFTDSHRTRIMQLADFVAWTFFRCLEHGDGSFLTSILSCFDRGDSQANLSDGLKHMTVEPCSCPARH